MQMYSDRLRVVPALLLIYVWVRALTAEPISTYSLSLYQGLPADLLVVLGLAGLSLLLIARDHAWWMALLVSQFLVAVTVVPSLQTQYLHFTTDSYMHIGRMKRILEVGVAADRNLYPLLHWFSAMLSEVTDLSPTITALLVVTMMSAILGLLLVLCIRRLNLLESVYRLMIFAAVLATLTPDLFNFASWGQFGRLFTVLVIFVVFLSLKSGANNTEWLLTLLVILTAAVFAHPLISLITLCILCTILAYQSITDNIIYRVSNRPILLLPPAIGVVYWLLNAPTFNNTFASIIGSIFLSDGGDSSRLARRTEQLSSADIATIDIVIEFVAQYGYVVSFLGSLLIIISLRTIFLRNRESGLQPLAIAAVAFWALGAAMFVLPVPFGPGRFWAIAIILGVFVVARDLTAFIQWSPHSQKPALIGTFAILILVAGIAAPTLYGSELSRSPSEQMTKAESSGVEWLFEHEDDSEPIQSIGTPVRNIRAYEETSDSFRTGTRPKPHFQGIREDSFEGYLLLAPPAGQTYPAYYSDYPETWDYTPIDYNWIENGTDTARIYTSGDTSVYRTT
ncbi:hypothetical protein HTZ84_10675 [Haloterrigena sp. SYSU A558-1]|uniref:Glycosyltransferase RgtA/B/C/D-like domain-containing protein n=1 Tax=Haloterrigena gelatinilytica TaxID=2741724 RepID=A0ABX2LEI4_9EURY|nr:hypothetical protein [Haloterrigena gelatinilytica]NUC72768.1 hypothetical protein [Haloterrigena gelatinilytica]